MNKPFDPSRVVGALRGLRVTPSAPAGFTPGVSPTEADEPIRTGRDGSSGWSVYVRYVNAKGEQSERRLTCQKLVGYAEIEQVMAYCHETKRLKSFRIDSIQEMIDQVTGEVVDPLEHLTNLHRDGLMGMKDKALDDFATVLVFLARCDGEYHPLEEVALEDALSRYCLRFGGDDCVVDEMIGRLDRLAPDGRDMIAGLGRLAKTAHGPALARLILNSATEVIEADGQYAAEELEWGGLVQMRLKQLSAR